MDRSLTISMAKTSSDPHHEGAMMPWRKCSKLAKRIEVGLPIAIATYALVTRTGNHIANWAHGTETYWDINLGH